MREEAPEFSADEREILPLLPLLYVAWADGELTAEELAELRAHLPEAVSGGLNRWLDPANPPSAQELAGLLVRLRRAAKQYNLEPADKRSLAALGQALAQQAGGDLGWSSEKEIAALRAVEKAMGMYGQAAGAVFFPAEDVSLAPTAPDVEAPFDIAALTALLDGKFAAHKHKVREVLRDPLFRHPGEMGSAAYRALVLTWCHELARRGLTDTLRPAIEGGAPDLGGFAATFEELACFDLSLLIKFGVQFGLFGCSVLFLGSDAQKRRYLPDILDLKLPGCFAMTERGHGSNVRGLETVARYDAETEEFVVDTPHHLAGKEWIGNAAVHGHMATVFARLLIGEEDYGVHAFLVPIRRSDDQPAPRVRIADCGHKMGLNGVDNGRLWFDKVRVPRDALLARYATVAADGTYESPIASPSRRFFTMLGALVGGRVSIAAASVAVARSALTIAVRYTTRRRQFGPDKGREVTILSYPIQQRRLMPLLARTYALHFANAALIETYASSFSEARGEGEDRRDLEAHAAGLKALASWHCTDTVQACREACGGQGYASINRFADLKADSDVFATFEGDNTVLVQLVAKAVLGQFRARFSDPSPLAVLRQIGKLAASTFNDKNPIVKRWSASEHLRDGDFHRDIFAAREEERAREVALGLQREIRDGTEPFEAFNRWQIKSIDLAHAHVERLINDSFRDVVEACADPALKATLNDLCDLYALDVLDRDRAWLIERGYLTTSKAGRLSAEVDALCAELTPRARALVEAFAIPASALGAPIAL